MSYSTFSPLRNGTQIFAEKTDWASKEQTGYSTGTWLFFAPYALRLAVFMILKIRVNLRPEDFSGMRFAPSSPRPLQAR
jgi:hypothetical protein